MRPDPQRLLEPLPQDARAALGALAGTGATVYIVGGAVRDALLGRPTRDLDLVIEGEAQGLARRLQEVLGGELTCHEAFLTCTLTTPALTFDFATARAEHYAHPGALPEVRPASLSDDLFRRDFTVNALAVRLAPAPREFVDLYGGLEDLRAGLLHTFHAASFIDDPTRIVRGARLAGRLGFRFHESAEEELDTALRAGAHTFVSPARFKNELRFTLGELQVAPALGVLETYGALESIYGLRTTPLLESLDALRREGEVPDESYLLALLMALPDEEAAAHALHFGWPRRLLETRARLLEIQKSGGLEATSLSAAEKRVLEALDPELREQVVRLEPSKERPRLRGQDVLDLGLPAGPKVGEVLREVSRARAAGRVGSFAEELALAQKLVNAINTQERA